MSLPRIFVLALALTGAFSIATVTFAAPPDWGIQPIARASRPVPAIDTHPDPRVFETTLVAREAEIDLDGDGRPESVHTFGGTVPGPEIRVRVGDTVIVHFKNELPKSSSIHWHGIELNNTSDGTPVTQNAVLTGQSYRYKFIVTRPGVFWYHPHFKPTNDEFKGQYGSIIVEDPREDRLRFRRVLPKRQRTMTLMLADTTICERAGENDTVTFPADPDLPWAGPGAFPGNLDGPSPQALCEAPMDDQGNPLGGGALPAGAIPNVQPPVTCGQTTGVQLTGIAFVPGQAVGTSTLYGIDSGGVLYRVMSMMAEIEEVGPTGFAGTHGLGFDPLTGRLWSGSTVSREVISADPATGTAAVEFPFGNFTETNIRDLAFLDDGSLFAVGHSPGTVSGARLYSVDRTTGVWTRILSGGQGITANSPTSLLQNLSRPFPQPDQFGVVDLSVDPPTQSTLPGWPTVPVATQLARQPGTDIVYGINGCASFCLGELVRYDLSARTGTVIGTPAPPGCQTNDGQLVLTNGHVVAARAGSPESPGDLAEGPGIVDVKSGTGIRLQIINAAVSRYFRLKLTDQRGYSVPLYRIGGEGGLLDHVRLEGGLQDRLDTKFESGEIVLGPSQRADVVAIVPRGRRGDVATLWTLDYSHARSGFANNPTVPVLHLRNLGNGPQREKFSMKAEDPLRTHPRIDVPTEDLKILPVLDHLLDPAGLADPRPGSDLEEIRLTTTDRRPSIDDVPGGFPGLLSDFRLVPHLPTSRYARVGNLLELAVANETRMHHPFHLHGFSFQPVRIEDLAGNTVREYDYNEFVDTLDIPGGHRLVFRVRLDDRFQMDGVTPGGAVGRWLFHCHISFHAGLGMISELVVLP